MLIGMQKWVLTLTRRLPLSSAAGDAQRLMQSPVNVHGTNGARAASLPLLRSGPGATSSRERESLQVTILFCRRPGPAGNVPVVSGHCSVAITFS